MHTETLSPVQQRTEAVNVQRRTRPKSIPGGDLLRQDRKFAQINARSFCVVQRMILTGSFSLPFSAMTPIAQLPSELPADAPRSHHSLASASFGSHEPPSDEGS